MHLHVDLTAGNVGLFIKNTWYVAAWSVELQANTLLDRTIAGNRIVLFRDADGIATALRNRCCHRSAPLSAGTHEGDGIRCGYHGLKFSKTGQCVEIPGQSQVPPNAKVDRFMLVERRCWIWVWTGDPAFADPGLIPEMREMENANWNMLTGYLHYDTNYQLIHDNLLDFSHLSYVHAATLGGGSTSWADTIPVLKRLTNGISFERWLENVAPMPFLHSILGKGRQDVLNMYEFYINGALTIENVIQPSGSGTREKMSDIGGMRGFSWQAVTPETENTAHYFFSTGLEKIWPAEVLEVKMTGIYRAFDEDRKMIHAQQNVLSGDPERPQISVVATGHDRGLTQMRAMIKQAIEKEKPGSAFHA